MKQFQTLMAWLSSVFRKAKELLVAAFLSLVYFILFGIFLVVVAVFDRKLLWPEKKKNTFWIGAEGYGPDIDECMRQS